MRKRAAIRYELLMLAALGPYGWCVGELLLDSAPAHRVAPLSAPLLAIGIAWLSRRRFPTSQAPADPARWLAPLLAAAAIATSALGHPLLCAPLLPAACLVSAGNRGGSAAIRWALAPALLTLLVFPAAALAEGSSLALALQALTARLAAGALSGLGVAASASGIFVDTGRFTGVVTSGCAGLNTALGLTALGLCVAQLEAAPPRRLGLLVATCLGAGLLANVLRVSLLTGLGHLAGADWVQSALHDLTGLLLFVAALVLALRVLPPRPRRPEGAC